MEIKKRMNQKSSLQVRTQKFCAERVNDRTIVISTEERNRIITDNMVLMRSLTCVRDDGEFYSVISSMN